MRGDTIAITPSRFGADLVDLADGNRLGTVPYWGRSGDDLSFVYGAAGAWATWRDGDTYPRTYALAHWRADRWEQVARYTSRNGAELLAVDYDTTGDVIRYAVDGYGPIRLGAVSLTDPLAHDSLEISVDAFRQHDRIGSLLQRPSFAFSDKGVAYGLSVPPGAARGRHPGWQLVTRPLLNARAATRALPIMRLAELPQGPAHGIRYVVHPGGRTGCVYRTQRLATPADPLPGGGTPLWSASYGPAGGPASRGAIQQDTPAVSRHTAVGVSASGIAIASVTRRGDYGWGPMRLELVDAASGNVARAGESSLPENRQSLTPVPLALRTAHDWGRVEVVVVDEWGQPSLEEIDLLDLDLSPSTPLPRVLYSSGGEHIGLSPTSPDGKLWGASYSELHAYERGLGLVRSYSFGDGLRPSRLAVRTPHGPLLEATRDYLPVLARMDTATGLLAEQWAPPNRVLSLLSSHAACPDDACVTVALEHVSAEHTSRPHSRCRVHRLASDLPLRFIDLDLELECPSRPRVASVRGDTLYVFGQTFPLAGEQPWSVRLVLPLVSGFGDSARESPASAELYCAPNPATGSVVIQSTDGAAVSGCTYAVVDALGRMVQRGTLTRGASLHTAGLPSGQYVVRLHWPSGKTATTRLIVAHP